MNEETLLEKIIISVLFVGLMVGLAFMPDITLLWR